MGSRGMDLDSLRTWRTRRSEKHLLAARWKAVNKPTSNLLSVFSWLDLSNKRVLKQEVPSQQVARYANLTLRCLHNDCKRIASTAFEILDILHA